MTAPRPHDQGHLDDPAPGDLVELVALAAKDQAVRCRGLEDGDAVTLRTSSAWEVVPGVILTVRARKRWRFGGHPYLSGEIEDSRLDVGALGLTPLRLEARGTWDPAEVYWGEDGEPIQDWARPIIARGPRPEFEMEQVIPGEDPDDLLMDPILESNDLKEAGDGWGARRTLMEVCQADLRSLDAHAHLGNLWFHRMPGQAVRHYEVGLRIGELSLGAGFDGVLPWGLLDNRPFLRCLQGYGLCLWRLDRFEEAERVFERMLWLNPSDDQGIRFLIGPVAAREPWAEEPWRGRS